MLKYDDSMVDLHKICQIPMTCQYNFFGFTDGSRIFPNSFPSPEKFSFCTDKIESIEWQDLVPRQRIGECFDIHLPRGGLCDLLLSSYQTFPLEVLLRQCVFCKEPLLFCFATDIAISIFKEVSENTVLP